MLYINHLNIVKGCAKIMTIFHIAKYFCNYFVRAAGIEPTASTIHGLFHQQFNPCRENFMLIAFVTAYPVVRERPCVIAITSELFAAKAAHFLFFFLFHIAYWLF